MYTFIQTLYHRCDAEVIFHQSKSGFEIKVFFLLNELLTNLVCPQTVPLPYFSYYWPILWEKILIHTFLKDNRAKQTADPSRIWTQHPDSIYGTDNRYFKIASCISVLVLCPKRYQDI